MSVQYQRRFHRVFLFDRSATSVDKKNRFVLVPGHEEDGVGIWIAKVLLMF